MVDQAYDRDDPDGSFQDQSANDWSLGLRWLGGAVTQTRTRMTVPMTSHLGLRWSPGHLVALALGEPNFNNGRFVLASKTMV